MPGEHYELSEMSVLGKILEDPSGNTMLSVVTQLRPDDFVDKRNRLIYSAFIGLSEKQQAIDITNTVAELDNNKSLEAVGGEDYLNLIIEKTNPVTSIDEYISNIRDKSLLAKFLKTLTDITDRAKTSPITDINEFIGNSENEILSVSKQRRIEEISRMDDLSDEIVSNLVNLTTEFQKQGKSNPDRIVGISTGYSELDRLTSGWEKGDMIVIGARPSVGKTAFALNLLYRVAKQGIPVVFFSLEMRAINISMRLLSLVSSLSTDDIYSLTYLPGSTKDNIIVDNPTSEQTAIAAKLKRGLKELSELPIYIDRNNDTSVLDINAKCKKLKNQVPDLGLVVIDYLGLIRSPTRRSENRQTEVGEISRSLKQMALKLNIPVIVLSQLNREVESREKKTDHRPQMSDLRDSGNIEQDADKILMLYRPDYYRKPSSDEILEQPVEQFNQSNVSEVEVMLLKNRNGRIGNLKFIFDKAHCCFSVVDDSHDF